MLSVHTSNSILVAKWLVLLTALLPKHLRTFTLLARSLVLICEK